MDSDSADISNMLQTQQPAYPHRFDIDTELAHPLLSIVQLGLHFSSRASGIVEVQLSVLEFLRQAGIFVS